MVAADPNGKASIELSNPVLGIGLRLSYDTEALPHLFHWKAMGQGTYVVGVEPANCSGIGGRAAARQAGDLPYLAPAESRNYALEIEVVEHS